jgi:4'-phosphopantetheinyl transferase
MSAEWHVVRHIPALRQDELQLWRVEIRDAARLLSSYTSLLTVAEKYGLARRRAGPVREQFAFGRGCLRLLLGQALNLDPLDVPILADIHGKPLTPEVGGRNVSYNVAHSKDVVLIALRRHGAVGVDIEHVDETLDVMQVAKHSFTSKENETLASMPDLEDRRKLFYRYWTRKEAVAKADGRGLLLSPTSFEVTFGPTEPDPARVQISSQDAAKLYLVSDLPFGGEMYGALAMESPASDLTRLIFPLDSALSDAR